MSSPIDIPVEVLETIFKFLPSEVLLEASLVCHSWYTVIGSSKQCMNRIRIIVKEGKKMQFGNVLEQSLRRYEHFKIEDRKFFMSLVGKDETSLENVFKSLPHLKSLSIYFIETNILEAASKYLTKLEVIDTKNLILIIPNKKVIFPNLKDVNFILFTKIANKDEYTQIADPSDKCKEVVNAFRLGFM